MIINAKFRLLADAGEERDKISEKIEALEEQIAVIRKGLPSKNNRMAVSEENQITKRKQILKLESDIQDLRAQRLRIKDN